MVAMKTSQTPYNIVKDAFGAQGHSGSHLEIIMYI